MSITRAVYELVKATVNLGRAKIICAIHPCPPHDYGAEDESLFCLRCGQYRS